MPPTLFAFIRVDDSTRVPSTFFRPTKQVGVNADFAAKYDLPAMQGMSKIAIERARVKISQYQIIIRGARDFTQHDDSIQYGASERTLQYL